MEDIRYKLTLGEEIVDAILIILGIIGVIAMGYAMYLLIG